MKRWRSTRTAVVRTNLTTLLLLCLGAVDLAAQSAQPAAAGDGRRLTLERLYSLPDLIGTAPAVVAWSGDGSKLAFLWNDEGRRFRDVWVVDTTVEQLRPVRWTRWNEVPASGHTQEGSAESGDPLRDPLPDWQAADAWEVDPGVEALVWHPTTEQLLVSFQGDLWSVSGPGRTRRVTDSAGRETAATYSPDGCWLAFLVAGRLEILSAGVERGAICGNVPLRVAPSLSGEGDGWRTMAIRWAPGGRRLALHQVDSSDVPRRTVPDYLTPEPSVSRPARPHPGERVARHRVGWLEIGEESRAIWLRLPQRAETSVGGLAERRDQILDFAWSPHGRQLAVDVSDWYAKDRRVFVASVEGAAGAPRLVWRDADSENETFYFWRIAWDRSQEMPGLFVLSDRADDYHVYRVDLGAAEELGVLPPSSRLTQADQGAAWAVAEMAPVADGLVIQANAPRPEERQIFLLGRGGTGPIPLTERDGTHDLLGISPDGRWAAIRYSADDTPPDLWLTSLQVHDQGPRSRRVTDSPLDEFDAYSWVTPRYVTFTSHVDGATLHGRLTLPPNHDPSKKYPAILGSVYTDSVRNQWGGRTAHPTWALDQYLVQEGYVLLNVDMRGSWGKGSEFRRGIRLDYGGRDIDDLESGVKFLETLGFVDMDRIGIWGSSYGGLMTAMSLFRKPGLYAAGVAGAPATNVFHALSGQMAVMMEPTLQQEEYVDSSPYRHAQNLEDPLMIIHGMRDTIVLYEDTVELVHRLILNDKDVELVTLPDGGHGWDNEGLAQTRFAFRRLVEFFDRHLRE